jgi:zinc protease
MGFNGSGQRETTGSAKTRRIALWLGAWLGALLLTTLRSAQADELQCESVERYQLANGIDVVLQVDKALPLVSVVSSVHAGSRNDPNGYEGLAHYVEHLLFREGGPFASAFALYNGSGATVNAVTGPDTTNYLATLPSEQLERALWIEARRLGLGLNVVEEATAETEKQVVLREQAQSRGYKPLLAAMQAVHGALFGPTHPYHALLSTVDSIEPQTLESARWFFARYYRLDRVRLVVAGDFDPAAARGLIERYFGVLTSPPAPAPSQPESAAECSWAKQALVPSKHRVILSTRSENQRIDFTWPVPPGQDAEQLRTVLGFLMSRVADRARELDISHNVSIDLTSLELAKLWTLSIGLIPGVDFEKAEPLVWEAQAELAQMLYGSKTRRVTKRGTELIARLTKPSLLDRALKLTRRDCFETVCSSPTAEISAAQMAVFDKSNAVVLEARYGRNAPPEGNVEVLP